MAAETISRKRTCEVLEEYSAKRKLAKIDPDIAPMDYRMVCEFLPPECHNENDGPLLQSILRRGNVYIRNIGIIKKRGENAIALYVRPVRMSEDGDMLFIQKKRWKIPTDGQWLHSGKLVIGWWHMYSDADERSDIETQLEREGHLIFGGWMRTRCIQ